MNDETKEKVLNVAENLTNKVLECLLDEMINTFGPNTTLAKAREHVIREIQIERINQG